MIDTDQSTGLHVALLMDLYISIIHCSIRKKFQKKFGDEKSNYYRDNRDDNRKKVEKFCEKIKTKCRSMSPPLRKYQSFGLTKSPELFHEPNSSIN